MMRRWIAAALAMVALAAVGCGDSSDGADTAPSATGSVDEAPAVTKTSGQVEDDGDGRERKIGFVGDELRDGVLTFQVSKVEPSVARLPVDFSDPIVPPAGATMAVVTVTVRNDGKVSVMPFCGGTGVRLIDEEERNFDLVDDAVSVVGNDTCNDLQPGFKTTARLPFFLPDGATVDSIALWDPNEEALGELNSYVLISLDPARQP